MNKLKARFGGLFYTQSRRWLPPRTLRTLTRGFFFSPHRCPHQRGQSVYRMDSTSHQMPYWWSACLAFFSTLTLYDCVFCIGAAISAFFTIKTYYASRRERRQQLEEERKRTEMLRAYLDSVIAKPESERPTAAEVMAKATEGERKTDDDT